MISDRLFVYGTLDARLRPSDGEAAVAQRRFLGEATCRGRLYLIKQYPGLVLSDDPAEVVFGELYRLRARGALLGEFDVSEACGEGFAEPTEYVRQMLPVAHDNGADGEAWTYVCRWPVARLPQIAAGEFMEQ